MLVACPTEGDLLNPSRLFGGQIKMVPNFILVAKDVGGFLEMRHTETYFATEYHLLR